MLNLRPGVREHFLTELGQTHPKLIPIYERLYGRPYLDPDENARRMDVVRREVERADIADRRDSPIHVEPAPLPLTLF
ncbi:MAG: hypothetical protein JWM90_1432 [Thermoleophilia bacterium]|nr:hypothetical protein [Thermoleophilia bacterium]